MIAAGTPLPLTAVVACEIIQGLTREASPIVYSFSQTEVRILRSMKLRQEDTPLHRTT
jgi:hypothetical protein